MNPSAKFPPQLTLYYSPKACSLASHIVLEESGLAYDAVCVDIRKRQHVEPAYLRINPNHTVPALDVGGSVITESQAVLTYVADLVPERELMPRPGTRSRARAHEWMNWIASTVHPTFTAIFRPAVFAGDDPGVIDAVRAHAARKLPTVLREAERRLCDPAYAIGPGFSVVEAYLFVFYLWTADERIPVELPQLPRYSALGKRVWDRPWVRTVVARERAQRAYALPGKFAADMGETA